MGADAPKLKKQNKIFFATLGKGRKAFPWLLKKKTTFENG